MLSPYLPRIRLHLRTRYLNERRLNGNEAQTSAGAKRGSADTGHMDGQINAGKRPRGRPKGSKNRSKAEGSGIAGAGVMM